MAPEQASGGAVDGRADQFAAGVVLYELLTGETPFHGGSAATIFQRHLDEDAIAPSLRCPDAEIAPALDRIVLRALAKDPSMRYASAAQFATALTAAMPASDRARPLDGLRPTGFSTEAPTQDWPAAPRRRFAEGTHPQPIDRADQLRSAVGAAIVAGDTHAIASSYLELARSLVADRHADVAVRELEQAVDVLTAGDGPATQTPPSPLWRVLLALAAIYDGIGEAGRARMTARHAWCAASHAHSPTGQHRAAVLLQRLAHNTAS
jgi:serine/threonine-protein kinase